MSGTVAFTSPLTFGPTGPGQTLARRGRAEPQHAAL
jgi:hypothetical protein